jgi:hypothetical protein
VAAHEMKMAELRLAELEANEVEAKAEQQRTEDSARAARTEELARTASELWPNKRKNVLKKLMQTMWHQEDMMKQWSPWQPLSKELMTMKIPIWMWMTWRHHLIMAPMRDSEREGTQSRSRNLGLRIQLGSQLVLQGVRHHTIQVLLNQEPQSVEKN